MSYNYQDYYSINKRKYKLKWALHLLIVQIVLWCIWAVLIWINYSAITRSHSVSEKYTQRHYVAVEDATQLFEKDGILKYEWYFGSIYNWTKTTNSGAVEFKSITKVSIDINQIRRILYLKQILDLWYIDKPIFDYLSHKNQTDFNIAINDLNILWSVCGISLPLDISSQNEVITTVENHLSSKSYTQLAHYLKWLDDALISKFASQPSNLILDANFIETQDFAYLMDKIQVDSRNFYATHIQNSAKLFNINPNLIKSVIMTEQMRAAFTYRGRVKQIIATDTYLMVMSQSSYWVGWIKSNTAITLENYLQSNNTDIYDAYFAYSDSVNIYNERFARLTSTIDYKYQIYYIAGIMYKYIQDWKASNVNISNLPGIIITLYNVWDKTPTMDPKIWWSKLNIEWEQYTFWKLWMFIYYYLEIYGE